MVAYRKKFIAILIFFVLVSCFTADQTNAVEEAPDLNLKNAKTGEQISLSDYEGKVVVLDFFATWCGPCKSAIREELVPLWNQYYENNSKVVFLSIDIWEKDITSQELKDFAGTYDVEWPVLMGSDTGAAEKYGVEAVPTLVVVGPDGKIRKKHVGVPDSSALRGKINDLTTGTEGGDGDFPITWTILAICLCILVLGGIVYWRKRR